MSLIDKLFDSIFNGDENSVNEFEKKLNETQPNIDYTKININFKNLSNNPNPEYGSEGASGFDIRAYLESSITIQSGDFVTVPTGLYFELPDNFEIQVRPRSGLASKNGVTVLNTPGTVDSDYTGEIKIILINHSKVPFTINNGDRIAQGVLATALTKKIVNLNQIKELTKETQRGSGGFGSTGIK